MEFFHKSKFLTENTINYDVKLLVSYWALCPGWNRFNWNAKTWGGYGPPAPPLPAPLCRLKSASGFSQERSPQLWPGLALEFLWEKADQNLNCFRTLPILYAAAQWLGHFNCISNLRKNKWLTCYSFNNPWAWLWSVATTTKLKSKYFSN